jgi:hypothetical protein
MQSRPDPNEKLIEVFESEQESEALIVRGLLESAGIDALAQSIDVDQGLFPVGGVKILVREDQAGEARRLIAENRTDNAANLEDEREPKKP